MSNRVVIGRRTSASNDRGLMISGLDTSSGSGTSASPYARANVLSVNAQNKGNAVHNFDSGEHVGGGFHVFHYTQGSLNKNTNTNVTHNWGKDNECATADRPLFALRWSYASDISSGVATKCYKPMDYQGEFQIEEDEEDGVDEENFQAIEGVDVQHVNNNTINIDNLMLGDNGADNNHNGHTIYWALVVFYEDDWNGGRSI